MNPAQTETPQPRLACYRAASYAVITTVQSTILPHIRVNELAEETGEEYGYGWRERERKVTDPSEPGRVVWVESLDRPPLCRSDLDLLEPGGRVGHAAAAAVSAAGEQRGWTGGWPTPRIKRRAHGPAARQRDANCGREKY